MLLKEDLRLLPIRKWLYQAFRRLSRNEKSNDLSGVDPNRLDLWKVLIPTRDENNVKWKILNKKPPNQINIKVDLWGDLLQSDDIIEKLFDGQPTVKHIHIIVQLSPPTTTGKCLPMVYLLNKKFVVTKYDLVWSLFFVLKQVPPSKASHRVCISS